MASILKVDTLQKPDGSTPTAADLGIDVVSGDMPAGSIIQNLMSSDSGNVLYSNSSYFEPSTSFRITITPKEIGNIIRIHCMASTNSDIDSDSHVSNMTQHRVMYSIGGGTATQLIETEDAIDDRGGQSRQRHISIVKEFVATSLDPIEFSFQTRRTYSANGRNAMFNYGLESYWFAQEIKA